MREDLSSGLLRRPDLDWPAIWRRCRELSDRFALTTGGRTLDALHVATALILGVQVFVTFDVRQRELAREAGLKVRP